MNYRHGNRLTLGQLSRFLVNHNCVIDRCDDLVDTVIRDAARTARIRREQDALKRRQAMEDE